MREHREDRRAVHHRGFEKEFAAARAGEVAKFAVGVDDRTFVRADGVRAGFERGLEMGDGGLAGETVERSGFEDDVGLGLFEPLADVLRRGPLRRLGEMAEQQGLGVEAVRIGDPADAARGYACEFPFNGVVVAETRFLGAKEANEFLADVAEADEGEFVGANRVASYR
ncbi:MAG TPA: hypothetical protein VLY23_10725 [Candidatus Acidoferrum sp.]|nr:hypothetical protein [Candidatus Acidoferrum sp.]